MRQAQKIEAISEILLKFFAKAVRQLADYKRAKYGVWKQTLTVSFLDMKNVFFVVFFLFLIANISATVLAQTAPIKGALQNIADSLDQVSKINLLPRDKNQKAEELIARKIVFKNILALALAESNNLKNKLIDIKNLDGDFLKLRDQFLKELGNHANYYKSINDSLDKDSNLLKINPHTSGGVGGKPPYLDIGVGVNNLAQQFKDWRKIVYHGALEKIVNFLLIFETRDILEKTHKRFDNIASDLKRVEGTTLIKNSPLLFLLEKARGSLEEAKQTQKAAEIIITKSPENSTQEISNAVLQKIKEVYDYFLQMSGWVKKSK